jgi:hypothetical protein
MRMHVEQPERSSPGMANQRNPVLMQSILEVVDNPVEIGNVARNRQLVRIGIRVERTPRPALIPIDNREVLFEIAVEISK